MKKLPFFPTTKDDLYSWAIQIQIYIILQKKICGLDMIINCCTFTKKPLLCEKKINLS